MNLNIIFEDEDYTVINKPAGLMVHSDGRSNEKTLCDFLIETYPKIESVGEPIKLNNGTEIKKPGIVHRLDRDTSGVMIVVKNQETFEYFKKLFQDREVEKAYHAFVYGNIKEEEGVINAPIGRNKNDFRQWFAGDNARGEKREAVTEFRVLKRPSDKSVTFLECRPKTGRTHQIRVHMKHIQHPILCDSLYAPNRECLLDFNRVALHSKKISFMDNSGVWREFETDYPDDFVRAINNLA